MFSGLSIGSITYGIALDDLFVRVLKTNTELFCILLITILLIIFSCTFGVYKAIHELEASMHSIADIERLEDYTVRNSLVSKSFGGLFFSFNSKAIHRLLERIANLLQNERKTIESQVLIDLAKQVSHDIRSPLSALTLVASRLDGLPEDQRILLRNASQRITDIANQLLSKSRAYVAAPPMEIQKPNRELDSPVMVAPLIEEIVSEKRTQFRELNNISLTLDIKEAYGLFIQIDPVELRRVISNLINNSVEAFDRGRAGQIIVAVKTQSDKCIIMIYDNGKGIPPQILEKVGTKGFTNGKDGMMSGSGLGLYHAKSLVELSGGKFIITSRENEGTIITISLNKTIAPNWFVNSLNISNQQQVVILDDDQTIHDVWDSRLSKITITEALGPIQHFRSGGALKEWMNNTGNVQDKIFLVDYELVGQKDNGLDWIEALCIADRSILVTSRYDENLVMKRCSELGVKLIPKSLVALVPIIKTQPQK